MAVPGATARTAKVGAAASCSECSEYTGWLPRRGMNEHFGYYGGCVVVTWLIGSDCAGKDVHQPRGQRILPRRVCECQLSKKGHPQVSFDVA